MLNRSLDDPVKTEVLAVCLLPFVDCWCGGVWQEEVASYGVRLLQDIKLSFSPVKQIWGYRIGHLLPLLYVYTVTYWYYLLCFQRTWWHKGKLLVMYTVRLRPFRKKVSWICTMTGIVSPLVTLHHSNGRNSFQIKCYISFLEIS